ncbi:division plane positioning ATPase MipZ [Candidatus Vondammii sp. HM_W22]|uniref:division plane positioning ATPase MipZ n=1 Tax=Candidatus Vondammii sp. HM_W22 TaxID=2687299 RepID=UPI001F12A6A1|nr:division plane positioning ATPase MipZ [Candidatus Vondammii sp. HM_W22]
MIILFGGEKGGTGKTTIATNVATWLANYGKDVVLVDTDKQGTASRWVARRNEYYPDHPKIHISRQTGNVFQAVRDLATRYEEVVIDAGGHDSEELRTAMVACDKLYVPLRASQPDIETTVHVSELVKLAKSFNPSINSYALISQAPTNPFVTERQEAEEVLSELEELVMAKQFIRDRKAYRDVMADGLGVVEVSGKGRAEMQLLCQEIYGEELLNAEVT